MVGLCYWYHFLLALPYLMHLWYHWYNLSFWPWQCRLQCIQVSPQGSCKTLPQQKIISPETSSKMISYSFLSYMILLLTIWGSCGLTCNHLHGNIRSSKCLRWYCWWHMGHRGLTHNSNILKYSLTPFHIVYLYSLYHIMSFDTRPYLALCHCGR